MEEVSHIASVEYVLPRVLWTLVGFLLISWAFLLLAFSDTYSLMAIAEVVLGGWGLGTIATVWVTPDLEVSWFRGFAWATAIILVAGFGLWAWMQIRVAPAYGTDEIAFDQYAALVASHFHNPYLHSMAPSFSLFNVSPNGYTFHLNGSPVTSLSYPSMSFLLYVPLIWLGFSTQLAVVFNVICWALAALLTFHYLPSRMRPLALIIGSFAVYTGFAVGGVTDIVYLVPLIFALYRWDRYWSFGPWRSRLVPVAMGLACAVKQTPWLIVPFLLTALYIEERERSGQRSARQLVLRYVEWSAGAFLVVNLPFIVSNADKWLVGILTPIASDTVPAGQGSVALSIFFGLGGGNLAWFSLTLIAVAAALYLFFILTYPRLKALTILVPSFVLFFSARSFSNYMVILALPALVALTSVDLERTRGHAFKRRLLIRWAAIGSIGVGGVFAILSFISQPALTLQIQSIQTTGQLATIVQVNVNVQNNSNHSIDPSYTIENGGSLTAFWYPSKGSTVLAPHQSATVSLVAPNFFAQPPLTGGFQIAAFTQGPNAIAVSSPYIANQLHVDLVPEAVNKPVAIGAPVTFTAQVVDAMNNPVHTSGLPVYLGQIVYTQSGLVYGQASINGGQIGQTPVDAFTNSDGRVKFTVVGTVRSVNPVYFEANLVNGTSFYPYGYSDIVPIRFE